MNNTVKLLLLVGGTYLAIRVIAGRRPPAIRTKEPLPPGGVPTGKVESTSSGAPPGEEVLGFAPRDWAEILLPSGYTKWMERE